MKCPTCNIPLTATERAGVAFEGCTKCGGVWLDLYRLDLILYKVRPKDVVKYHKDDEGSDLKMPPVYESRRHG